MLLTVITDKISAECPPAETRKKAETEAAAEAAAQEEMEKNKKDSPSNSSEN